MVISHRDTQTTKISKKQDGRNIYVILKQTALAFIINSFVATHSLGNMMQDYTLLVTINQRVPSNLSNGGNNTHSAKITQEQDERNKYMVIKTMCPADYHHHGFKLPILIILMVTYIFHDC